MSIPRSILQLSEQLLHIKKLSDPFAPGFQQRLEESGMGDNLISDLNVDFGEKTGGPVLMLALQCLSLNRASAKHLSSKSEFVATTPADSIPGVRKIASVIKEMIREARSEIISLMRRR